MDIKKMDQLKVALSILKEFSEGTIPSAQDYDMDKETFGTIIESLQIAGYIRGAKISRCGSASLIGPCILNCVKVEMKGLEYLHEHSALMETYKGLKEIRSWIPFMY